MSWAAQFALATIASPCYTDDRFAARGRLRGSIGSEGLRSGPLSVLPPSQNMTEFVCPPRSRRVGTAAVVCCMRLERLEINGFKSFSDRSELAFDKGVTAIVGPNGCGKSNVADAITWVMGEQSAKSLRGDRMEDVIFSGSDARKPTAAAEVRLRFSGVREERCTARPSPQRRAWPAAATAHSQRQRHQRQRRHGARGITTRQWPDRQRHDGHRAGADELIQSVAREVEVTRRLYRSGESEYLIDGQICRLRDVHELLMDTGLGAKAYAIIEQGKIGLILSSRPTDRRQLIEEAAGVTKYKARRRSAELKLEAAQQNLTRIDDIVFEVEKQRGTLKRQAAKARRYQKLRDELRRWEKVLFARKYRQLAETIESARDAAGRRARARSGGGGAASPRSKPISAACASSSPKRSPAPPTAREAAHARELDDQPPAAADRVRHGADRGARRARGRRWPRSSSALDARREPARARRSRRRERGRGSRRERDRAARALGDRLGGVRSRRIARSRGSRPTSRRRAARCSRRSMRRRRSAIRSSTPAPRASAWPRRCRSCRSKPTTCGSSAIGSTPIRGGLRRRCGARRTALGAHAHRARGARIGAGERAHRARVARAFGPRPRAGARRTRSAAEVARGAAKPLAPSTAMRRAPCSRRPTARSASRARSPTISKWTPATSAPSRPASAICSSTSSSSSPNRRRPASARARAARGPLRLSHRVRSGLGDDGSSLERRPATPEAPTA